MLGFGMTKCNYQTKAQLGSKTGATDLNNERVCTGGALRSVPERESTVYLSVRIKHYFSVFGQPPQHYLDKQAVGDFDLIYISNFKLPEIINNPLPDHWR